MIEVGVRRANEEVIELVRKENPKYVLWLAYGEYYEIQESTFDAIRQEGAKVIGWFFDDEVRFDYYSKWWIPHLDYFITNDPNAVKKYKELGAQAIFAITDTWEAIERDWSKIKERYDVSFVGSLRADRGNYLKILRQKGIPINLFGEAGRKFVSYEEMMDIFATSKINLNFSKTYKYMKFGIKGRIFKVCLAGGFLLTEYCPGIEKYFEIDKEIVCFRNPEEMVDKIKYYLSHDEQRRAIAKAGWERAKNEYTAFHIMSRVFQEIENYSTKNENNKSKELIMPLPVRKRVSNFYKNWGKAFLFENYKGLWKDALFLSLLYDPSNKRARILQMVSYLPFPVRFLLIKPYFNFTVLRQKLFRWLFSKPLLEKIYHNLKKKLFAEDEY
jgi:spore maturation protein CgeB